MNENNNTHKMVTRSKRNDKGNLIIIVKNEDNDININNNNNLFELDEEWDDECIEKETTYLNKRNNKRKNKIINNINKKKLKLNEYDLDDDFIDDSILKDDSDDDYNENNSEVDIENELADIISQYINKNHKKYMNEDDDSKNKILKQYDGKMLDHFFSLNNIEQNKIIKIEQEIKNVNNELVPLRYQILNADIDIKVKAIAIRKLNGLNTMDTSSTEYYKLKSWVDGLMKIPFGKYKDLPITINNSSNEITDYMVKCSSILKNAVHGHQKAKAQIIQTIGKWISNPQSKGSVFSIVGPMGNGKTTLVKEGISKMINRPFEFISLGGATDSALLDGHSYTYEGAIPGKIVEILQKAECMNPVIYFDELDKISDTPKGEEIINLLIHLTDFSQNDHFIDKYYSDVPIDLSKALFIFSLNNLEKVNPILRDRMYMIQTNKLLEDDKLIICNNYLLPSLFKEVGISNEDIIFPPDIVKLLITKYSIEDGVRNFKRCLETILNKINILRLIKLDLLEDEELEKKIKELNFSKNMEEIVRNKKIIFPLTINKELIELLIDNNVKMDDAPFMMYS